MTISRKTVGIDKMQKARRANTEAHAPGLAAEEMSLRDLRKALGLTQVRLAKELGTEQWNISRIELRDDVLISTLSSYLKAMGGGLRLVAEFPHMAPIRLTGFSRAISRRRAAMGGRPRGGRAV